MLVSVLLSNFTTLYSIASCFLEWQYMESITNSWLQSIGGGNVNLELAKRLA